MIHVVTWLWGNKYSEEDAQRLERAVHKHLSLPHRFFVHRPDWHKYLWERGCIIRLMMWDRSWQDYHMIHEGDELMCLDLDLLVIDSIDHLFGRTSESLTILQDVNSTNPCPFNGSVIRLTAACRHDIWEDFSLENYAAKKVPFHAFPDDQGWLHHRVPHAGKYGSEQGVYAFCKRGWHVGGERVPPPPGSCIVAFPGWRDPKNYRHVPWIDEAMRA